MENLGSLAILQINDLKSIDVVEIELDKDGQFISLKGDNGVGKSTVMEAIEALFNGGKLPDKIIRNGKKEASIIGEFSTGYKALRRIRKNKNGDQVASLEIIRPDGGKVSAPQTVLKEVFAGYMTPSRLANMSGASLYNEVAKHFPDKIEKLQKELDSILDARRTETAIIGSLGSKTEPSEPVPKGAVAFDEERYFQLQDLVRECEQHKEVAEELTLNNLDLEKQIEELKAKIKKNTADIASANFKAKNLEEFRDELGAMKEARDMSAHSAALIKEWEIFNRWSEDITARNETVRRLQLDIKAKRKEILEAISSAVPVTGMKISEDKEILMNDVPWLNCAFSERLEAAALLQINSFPKDKLPIMFVEHGEALNKEKQQSIAKLAIESGVVVFMEIMDDSIDKLMINSEAVVNKSWEKKDPVKMPRVEHKEAHVSEVPDTPSAPPAPPEAPPKPSAYDTELDIF